MRNSRASGVGGGGGGRGTEAHRRGSSASWSRGDPLPRSPRPPAGTLRPPPSPSPASSATQPLVEAASARAAGTTEQLNRLNTAAFRTVGPLAALPKLFPEEGEPTDENALAFGCQIPPRSISRLSDIVTERKHLFGLVGCNLVVALVTRMIPRFGGCRGEIGFSFSGGGGGGGEGFTSPSTTLNDEKTKVRNTHQKNCEKMAKKLGERICAGFTPYVDLNRNDWRVVWPPDDRTLLG
ncbi:hypothetical protein ABZP36_030318 [Zizania latifolia]